jgi:hypothetical protein
MKEEDSKSIEESSEHALTAPIPIDRSSHGTRDVVLSTNSVPILRILPIPELPTFSLPAITSTLSSLVPWIGNPTSSIRSQQNYTGLWQTVCSICFDRNCEFSLPNCQDQFCRECMRHFLAEVVRNAAWGLARVEIKCPVCSDELTREVWSRYADRQTLDLYDRHVNSSKIVTRYCGACGTSLPVCEDLITSIEVKRR